MVPPRCFAATSYFFLFPDCAGLQPKRHFLLKSRFPFTDNEKSSFLLPNWSWMLLAVPGCSWLLAAPGCSWLLLDSPTFGILQIWDSVILGFQGFWDSGIFWILGFWDCANLGFWDSGSLCSWDSRILVFQDSGLLGFFSWTHLLGLSPGLLSCSCCAPFRQYCFVFFVTFQKHNAHVHVCMDSFSFFTLIPNPDSRMPTIQTQL